MEQYRFINNKRLSSLGKRINRTNKESIFWILMKMNK